ncbi:glycosyltransferase family 4 protein [uncultured Winogradskyella sp.]|uniref:glycosyltransferase family 4 protein n=1 Tax=uncultured Winogradskyella sp. TaxID=395353 RepID=UPI002614DC64|nr:glycosyltransferase family 4 protein [uncultured Winogradskyella sp.]
MKNLLYIGNKLNNSKSNLAAISIIGTLLEKEGYKLYYASSYNNKIVRLMDMLYACVKYRKKVDYVIIDTYSTLNFYFALSVSQLCRLLGVNYITRLNGGNLPRRLKSNRRMSHMIFNNAYVSISPSLYLKEKFSEFGYKNVKYIPNALNIDEYPFSHRDYDVPKLLWVRSFSEIYNPKLAVNVMQSLIEYYPNSELCMVGPDSDGSLSEVQGLANQLNLNIRFTGKLKKSEWIELSRSYNIFINTTNYDNTPVSVMEAMALGLPIVSTNVGGIPYLIIDEEEGLLVPKENEEAMTKAIMKLQNDEGLRKKLIKNARYKAENFDWSIVKQNWIELLS